MNPTLQGAQLATLKAFIAADPTLSQIPPGPDGDFDIAKAMNFAAAPDFKVWKTSVAVTALQLAPFDWSRVDNLTVGKARIWDWMTEIGVIDPSQANIRGGVEATFSVDAADGPCRQAIYNGSSRNATIAEKVFIVPASGTGAAPTNHGVGPATMAAEGALTQAEVGAARALP
jgi:hypothetical protein